MVLGRTKNLIVVSALFFVGFSFCKKKTPRLKNNFQAEETDKMLPPMPQVTTIDTASSSAVRVKTGVGPQASHSQVTIFQEGGKEFEYVVCESEGIFPPDSHACYQQSGTCHFEVKACNETQGVCTEGVMVSLEIESSQNLDGDSQDAKILKTQFEASQERLKNAKELKGKACALKKVIGDPTHYSESTQVFLKRLYVICDLPSCDIVASFDTYLEEFERLSDISSDLVGTEEDPNGSGGLSEGDNAEIILGSLLGAAGLGAAALSVVAVRKLKQAKEEALKKDETIKKLRAMQEELEKKLKASDDKVNKALAEKKLLQDSLQSPQGLSEEMRLELEQKINAKDQEITLLQKQKNDLDSALGGKKNLIQRLLKARILSVADRLKLEAQVEAQAENIKRLAQESQQSLVEHERKSQKELASMSDKHQREIERIEGEKEQLKQKTIVKVEELNRQHKEALATQSQSEKDLRQKLAAKNQELEAAKGQRAADLQVVQKAEEKLKLANTGKDHALARALAAEQTADEKVRVAEEKARQAQEAANLAQEQARLAQEAADKKALAAQEAAQEQVLAAQEQAKLAQDTAATRVQELESQATGTESARNQELLRNLDAQAVALRESQEKVQVLASKKVELSRQLTQERTERIALIEEEVQNRLAKMKADYDAKMAELQEREASVLERERALTSGQAKLSEDQQSLKQGQVKLAQDRAQLLEQQNALAQSKKVLAEEMEKLRSQAQASKEGFDAQKRKAQEATAEKLKTERQMAELRTQMDAKGATEEENLELQKKLEKLTQENKALTQKANLATSEAEALRVQNAAQVESIDTLTKKNAMIADLQKTADRVTQLEQDLVVLKQANTAQKIQLVALQSKLNRQQAQFDSDKQAFETQEAQFKKNTDLLQESLTRQSQEIKVLKEQQLQEIAELQGQQSDALQEKKAEYDQRLLAVEAKHKAENDKLEAEIEQQKGAIERRNNRLTKRRHEIQTLKKQLKDKAEAHKSTLADLEGKHARAKNQEIEALRVELQAEAKKELFKQKQRLQQGFDKQKQELARRVSDLEGYLSFAEVKVKEAEDLAETRRIAVARLSKNKIASDTAKHKAESDVRKAQLEVQNIRSELATTKQSLTTYKLASKQQGRTGDASIAALSAANQLNAIQREELLKLRAENLSFKDQEAKIRQQADRIKELTHQLEEAGGGAEKIKELEQNLRELELSKGQQSKSSQALQAEIAGLRAQLSKKQNLEHELDALRTQNSILEESLVQERELTQKAQKDARFAGEKMRQAQGKLAEMKGELKLLNKDRQSKTKQIKHLQKRIENLQAMNEKRHAEFSRLKRYEVAVSSPDNRVLLFKAPSPAGTNAKGENPFDTNLRYLQFRLTGLSHEDVLKKMSVEGKGISSLNVGMQVHVDRLLVSAEGKLTVGGIEVRKTLVRLRKQGFFKSGGVMGTADGQRGMSVFKWDEQQKIATGQLQKKSAGFDFLEKHFFQFEGGSKAKASFNVRLRGLRLVAEDEGAKTKILEFLQAMTETFSRAQLIGLYSSMSFEALSPYLTETFEATDLETQ